MTSQKLLILLLLGVMAVAVSANIEYPSWSLGAVNRPLYMKPGDSLKFSYPSGLHSVYLLYKLEDYENCNTDVAYAKYTSGFDMVTLPRQGTYYIVCGVESHCNAGMKLIAYVH